MISSGGKSSLTSLLNVRDWAEFVAVKVSRKMSVSKELFGVVIKLHF